MSRYHSYINSATEIIGQYNGGEPFASFLKKFFSQYKKYGSKDRKQISHLCYCYFRLGKSVKDLPTDEKILTGLFLCSNQSNDILQALRPVWNENVTISLEEKIQLITHPVLIEEIFSWQNQLSEGIDIRRFNNAHLQQPDLFLRIRPGKEKIVEQKLSYAGVSFSTMTDNCLALLNSSKVDTILELDKEVVVQDYSSQRVGGLIKSQIINHKSKLSLWDCCAASGGKSIMAKDILGDIDLTVSDVRESILVNLQKRLEMAGIKNYKSFIADLSKPTSTFKDNSFDLIIADVPCSGSGTWSRTPEQLVYFDEKQIEEYASLQKKIISTIVPKLKLSGYLLYITCSVFEKENENAVNFINEKFKLDLIKSELLKGYDKKADTMYAALFQKQG